MVSRGTCDSICCARRHAAFSTSAGLQNKGSDEVVALGRGGRAVDCGRQRDKAKYGYTLSDAACSSPARPRWHSGLQRGGRPMEGEMLPVWTTVQAITSRRALSITRHTTHVPHRQLWSIRAGPALHGSQTTKFSQWISHAYYHGGAASSNADVVYIASHRDDTPPLSSSRTARPSESRRVPTSVSTTRTLGAAGLSYL